MVKTIALSKRALAVFSATLLAVVGLLPVIGDQTASAAQLTSRSVVISSSKSGQTGVTWATNFTLPSAAVVQGIMFEFCTTPLGTCTQPSGIDVRPTTAEVAANQNLGGSGGGENFAEVASPGVGDCNVNTTAGNTKYCVSRTFATPVAANTPLGLTINSIRNPDLPGQAATYSTVFVRMFMYNNNTFDGSGSNLVHYGVVAAAITQQLTTQGRVQERLEFCVAAVEDSGITDAELPTNCSGAPTTTTVDLGVIDNSNISIAPIVGTPTNPANNAYGIAMLNTNSAGGVVVAYYPEADTSVANSDTHQLRSFRVAQTDCQDNTTPVFTDQCFESAESTGTVFAAGTERFGVYVPCIDATKGITSNLATTAPYNGTDGLHASSANCEVNKKATNVRFAWNPSNVAANLATSPSVVDNEIIKLSFGATASSTTPTGLYRVTTTYIATPTF